MKTFRFKLYHSDHNSALMRQINIAGLIYNHCIALQKRYYRLFGKYIKPYALMKHLTKLKRTKRFAYMRQLGSQAVQDVAERIDRAYNLFWSNLKRKVKCSPPKFKAVRRYKSFTLKQAGWSLDEACGRIRLGKRWYGYFQSRRIEGKVKTVTVKRDAVGNIYVYLCCDTQSVPVETRTGKSVGFDFGLKQFLTASDGQDITSPDFFKQNVRTIRTKCRALSRKQKGSHSRERARLELARAYRRMENQRKDFHFKLARKLCEEYACICLETLNIKGMARLLGQKIHSLGFSEFVKILEYEASKFGTQIVFVPPFFPSSQLCSACGYQNPDVKNLKVREWTCPQCHTHHERDRNAAKNILMAGASAISGDAVSPEQSGSVVDARSPRL
ncbi:MAG: transposase [Synergistaceae bacterium]|nr:transposase [Synergistaceae bacterium]